MNAIRRFWLSVLIMMIPAFLPLAASAEKKIGFLMFSDESRYVEAAKGIRDRLAEAGYREPGTRYIMAKAGANKAKAVELTHQFAAEKLDLIVAIGTSSAVIVAKEIKDVPIVFSTVYNPITAGIATSWKSSGNNTTGTSTLMPMDKVIKKLMLLRPVKRLAVLYTATEKNSESVLKDLQAVQGQFGIKIVPVLITTDEDIDQILPEALRTVDAVYVTGSNLVNSRVRTVVDMANRAGVVTVSHLEDLVEKGVLFGLCADSYALGRLAGEKAVKVLRGAAPSSIPIETLSAYQTVVNMQTVRAGRFPLPPAFLKTVTRKIE